MKIYDASCPGFKINPARFFDSNENALADMKRMAEASRMTAKQFTELQRLQRVLGLGEGDLLKLAHVEGVTFTCCSRNVSDLTSYEIGAVIAKA